MTMLGGALIVGMVRLTQYLFLLCEKYSTALRDEVRQSTLRGTESIQTVECGEEQREESRNLMMVAQLKSWLSGVPVVAQWKRI